MDFYFIILDGTSTMFFVGVSNQCTIAFTNDIHLATSFTCAREAQEQIELCPDAIKDHLVVRQHEFDDGLPLFEKGIKHG